MNQKPKLLDLYCCAGGAGRGYADAGFEVTGVDISPMPTSAPKRWASTGCQATNFAKPSHPHTRSTWGCNS